MQQSPKLIFISKPQPFFPQFTPQQYLSYTQLSYIFSQATKVYLRKPPPSSPPVVLSQFLQQYIRGQHVLLKSFSNFQKSSFSKLCFITNFSKIFDIEKTSGDKTGFDYLQLIRLVCSDFPKELVVNAVKLVLGDFEQEEGVVLEKGVKGEEFTKGLFMSCMYSEMVKELQGMGNVKVEKVLSSFKEMYRKKKMQFELPSYKVVIDTLLKIAKPTPNNNSSNGNSIVFINDDNIGNYISVSETISINRYLSMLYENEMNDREVSERLEFFDVLNLRVTEISKLLDNKDETGVVVKGKKKKK